MRALIASSDATQLHLAPKMDRLIEVLTNRGYQVGDYADDHTIVTLIRNGSSVQIFNYMWGSIVSLDRFNTDDDDDCNICLVEGDYMVRDEEGEPILTSIVEEFSFAILARTESAHYMIRHNTCYKIDDLDEWMWYARTIDNCSDQSGSEFIRHLLREVCPNECSYEDIIKV